MTNDRKILSFGSLNIDTVLSVPHIVKPGETLSANSIETFVGGKGLNQSIALSQAGSKVYHAGAVGMEDGEPLVRTLKSYGVDTQFISTKEGKSGNALIQVDAEGQNSILLFDGTNKQITLDEMNSILQSFGQKDVVILQNEVNLLCEMIDAAHERGMVIFFNPSPLNEVVFNCELEKIDWFIMNEIEAAQLLKEDEYQNDTLQKLIEKYPQSNFVITLGKAGAICYTKGQFYTQEIHKVETVDTTGAGDTFTGYFISVLLEEDDVQIALAKASIAAALSVTKKGASNSIPTIEQVEEIYLKN